MSAPPPTRQVDLDRLSAWEKVTAVAPPSPGERLDGPRAQSAATAAFCTSCGRGLDPSHRFCAACGAPRAG